MSVHKSIIWYNYIVYIKVRVKSESKRESVFKKNKDTYYLSVREPPLRNQANKRVCQIISSLFNVQIKKVRIINGHQNPSKLLSVNLEKEG